MQKCMQKTTVHLKRTYMQKTENRGEKMQCNKQKLKIKPKFYSAEDQTAKMRKNGDTECNIIRQN